MLKPDMPRAKLRRDLGAWIREYKRWKAAGMKAREPLTVVELNRRLELLEEARKLTA